MAEAASCSVGWPIISSDIVYPRFYVSPQITNGTLNGLLYGERTFLGNPVELDPRSPQSPALDPVVIVRPYGEPFIMSYRFRKEEITIEVRTPWDASKDELAGLAPYPMQFIPSLQMLIGSCLVVNATGGEENHIWTAGSAPNGSIMMALAEAAIEIDTTPDRRYELAFGTRGRNASSRAPLLSVQAGSKIRLGTKPSLFCFTGGAQSYGGPNAQFAAGTTVEANNGTVARIKLRPKIYQRHQAEIIGEPYVDWWGRNGGFFLFSWIQPHHPKIDEVVGDGAKVTIQIS